MEDQSRKNRGGRPKVNEPYDKPIRVRFTQNEKDSLAMLCKKHKTDLSKYIRKIALEGLKHYNQDLTIERLILLKHEMHKIGVNVNQMATKINTYTKAHNALPEYGFSNGDKDRLKELEDTLSRLTENIKSITKI